MQASSKIKMQGPGVPISTSDLTSDTGEGLYFTAYDGKPLHPDDTAYTYLSSARARLTCARKLDSFYICILIVSVQTHVVRHRPALWS